MSTLFTPTARPLDSGLARLTLGEFNKLSSLIYTACGINLVESKKVMLESRLNKRLRELSISSFKEYIEYIGSKEGIETEFVHMIDVVTTNKTDFFREPHHFDFLRTIALPEFCNRQGSSRPFKVWSSACSTGEEPYTLAMVLQDYAEANRNFLYSILATDISTAVLQKAVRAVYPSERVATLPLTIKKRYLLKSRTTVKPTVRIVGDLRQKVHFTRLNLLEDIAEVPNDQDTIFCRNVLIYFDRKTQFKVVRKLVDKLRPGGYFFIGHSESLHQFDLPLTQVRPTIFLKQ